MLVHSKLTVKACNKTRVYGLL